MKHTLTIHSLGNFHVYEITKELYNKKGILIKWTEVQHRNQTVLYILQNLYYYQKKTTDLDG